MTTQTINYDATPDTFTITLASLADAAWRESTVFNNTTDKFVDAMLGGKITTGTTPTAGSAIYLYLYGTYDGTEYTAGCSGSDAVYTADGEEGLLFPIGKPIVVDATSDQTYVFGPHSVREAFGGYVPSKFGILVRNETGVALNATAGNHEVQFTGIKYDNA